ncbi:MAG: hypothetical protein N2234_09370 [Planctomycetota bacterium]|nr:hypothetical protein [Planctomycetota bacterium]
MTEERPAEPKEQASEEKKELDVDVSALFSKMTVSNLLVFIGAFLVLIFAFLPHLSAIDILTLLFSLVLICVAFLRAARRIGKQLFLIAVIACGAMCAFSTIASIERHYTTSMTVGKILAFIFSLGIIALGVLPLAKVKVPFLEKELKHIVEERQSSEEEGQETEKSGGEKNEN